MTTSSPVQSQVSYAPVLAFASTGSEAVSRERKVDPPPRLPSRPNLERRFGDKETVDYTVYLPSKDPKPEAGPTYSFLNPANPRRAV